MRWNDHTKDVAAGSHAFLSPSSYHWLRYDQDKILDVYANHLAALRGTEIHAFAAHCIKMNQKLPEKQLTLNMYVNDAIGFRMRPEQLLYFSPLCYGTADAIGFRENFLRVHDLKTGISETSFDQLLIYAALFCLEYDIRLASLKGCEGRIYQNDDVRIAEFGTDDIVPVMDKIVTFDSLINEFKEGDYDRGV